MLALIARINCKQLPEGRLVTAEEKEQLLEERSPSPDEATAAIPDDEEAEDKEANYGTLPNMENSELAIVSSDNESDNELLLDERTHRQTWIKNQLVDYYHWILVLSAQDASSAIDHNCLQDQILLEHSVWGRRVVPKEDFLW